MAPRTTYANLPDGLQLLGLFDQSFADTALLGTIPCTAVGTNMLTLTPLPTAFAPVLQNYFNYALFSFVAAHNSTVTPVTVSFLNLPPKNLYAQDGATLVQLTAGFFYTVAYSSLLNSGAGGFYTPNDVIAPVGNITINSTVVSGGTSGRVLYDNAGTVGELPVTGSGSVVLATSPSISALTVTSSFTATGLVTNADLVHASVTINGVVCTLGGTATIGGALTVGTTAISSGVSQGLLYNNSGVLANSSANIGNNTLVISQNASATPFENDGSVALQIITPDGTNGGLQINGFLNAGGGVQARLRIRNAEGIGSAPTALQSGSQLGSVNFEGYDGTVYSFNGGASIDSIATQIWTAAHHGSNIILRTTPNNSTSVQTGLLIDQDQSITIGNLTAGAAAGIVINDAGGRITSITSVTTASVPGNFSANRYLTVNIGGTNYNIPADTATW